MPVTDSTGQGLALLSTRMVALSRGTQTRRGLLGLGSSQGRQLLLCATIVMGFVLLMVAGWNHYAGDFAQRKEFLLSPREILITTPPAWIQSNVLIDAVEASTLTDPLDLRDRELTAKVAETFASRPWIRQVHKVVKQYPAKVMVEVEYRRPVAMVEVIYGDNRHGLIPVDVEGTVLPTADFAPSQAVQYPRINVGRKPTSVSPGMTWHDPHVAEAASIAALLLEHWSALKLNRIVLKQETARHYELELTDDTRIIWGSAPGRELPQETLARHKVQVILQKAAEASLSNHEANPRLDLRTAGRNVASDEAVRR